MIMGQSAGTIAALALKPNPNAGKASGAANVHDVDLDVLHALLLNQGQLMNNACSPPPPPVNHKLDIKIRCVQNLDLRCVLLSGSQHLLVGPNGPTQNTPPYAQGCDLS